MGVSFLQSGFEFSPSGSSTQRLHPRYGAAEFQIVESHRIKGREISTVLSPLQPTRAVLIASDYPNTTRISMPKILLSWENIEKLKYRKFKARNIGNSKPGVTSVWGQAKGSYAGWGWAKSRVAGAVSERAEQHMSANAWSGICWSV